MAADVLTFLGIVLVLTLTPGTDMALVMRHVLGYGFSSIWATLAGILSGLAVHVTLCVAGLSVILRESEVAFNAVKLAGAAWLLWMGIGAFIAAARAASNDVAIAAASGGDDDPDDARQITRHAPSPGRRALYLRGLLTNLLNVKIALFYIAFLPQFAPRGPAFVPVALALAVVQGLIGFTWLLSYGVLVARADRALAASPRVRRGLEAITGTALVAFGLRLAAASR